MIEDSHRHANEDMASRALAEAQIDAERVVDATRSALAADGDLLDADERTAIDAAMATLQRLAAGADRHALSAATAALNKATEGFAEKRMDRSVRHALAGRSVDSLADQ